MLQIYDSLTKKKREFVPVKSGHVRIYVCGITVYDYCHIGHARAIILFDVIVRYLRSRGYHVDYVCNITDIDDKIINRANENGESCEALTERFIEAMHVDLRALGVSEPDFEPRATEYIPQIIALIEKIIEKDYGYLADNGPNIHHITIKQEPAKRIVLGAWHHQGSYLRVDESGESELLTCE